MTLCIRYRTILKHHVKEPDARLPIILNLGSVIMFEIFWLIAD